MKPEGLTLDPVTRKDLENFRGDSVDAELWANLFSRVFQQNPHAAADKGYLLSVFASAINAGADCEQNRMNNAR